MHACKAWPGLGSLLGRPGQGYLSHEIDCRRRAARGNSLQQRWPGFSSGTVRSGTNLYMHIDIAPMDLESEILGETHCHVLAMMCMSSYLAA